MDTILELTVACPICSAKIGELCATNMAKANGSLIGVCFHIGRLQEAEAQKIASIPPVDRTQRCMTSGKPEASDHRELLPNGQQKDYVVLCPVERAKGFVRPVRRSYIHKTCKSLTTMGIALAETYARDPEFYSGTFCCRCAQHFPLDQFVWDGTDEILGT